MPPAVLELGDGKLLNKMIMNMNLENKYLKLLIALGTVLCIYFAFEVPKVSFLIWVSLVPLLFILDFNRVFYSLFLAAYTGMIACFIVFYWVTFSHMDDTWVGTLIITFYVWIYITGVWTFLLTTAGRLLKGTMFALFGACVWVSMEILRGYLFSSFPWAIFGYSQYKMTHLIQIAEFTGVYGVSFLIVFFNLALFVFIKEKNWRPLALSAALILFSYCSGFVLMRRAYKGFDESKSINVVALQPNIPQFVKKESDYDHLVMYDMNKLVEKASVGDEGGVTKGLPLRQASEGRKIGGQAAKNGLPPSYFAHTKQIIEAGRDKPDLIIWPETSVPGVYGRSKVITSQINEIVSKSGVHHLIGTHYQAQGDNEYLYNVSCLMDPKANILYVHKKLHLVAFGEFVPFRDIFPCLDFLTALGDLSPGRAPTIMQFKGVNMGPSICSETFHGSLIREFVLDGADVMINHSNGAYFADTSALEQHFAMNVFRSIENRRMILECANTGVTALLAPTGEVLKRLDIDKRLIMPAKLTPNYTVTLYTKYGDIFAYLCIVFSILFTIFGFLDGGFKEAGAELSMFKDLPWVRKVRSVFRWFINKFILPYC